MMEDKINMQVERRVMQHVENMIKNNDKYKDKYGASFCEKWTPDIRKHIWGKYSNGGRGGSSDDHEKKIH